MHRLRRGCVFTLVFALTFAFVGENSAHAWRVNSQAPGDPSPQVVGGGGGFFAIGVHATDLSPLSDRFRRAGYPTFIVSDVTYAGGDERLWAGLLILVVWGVLALAAYRTTERSTRAEGEDR